MTTQQTKWGPEIPVDGERPEWLGDADTMQYTHRIEAPGSWGRGVARYWNWDDEDWACVVAIRLPADHPHYAQPEAPTPSPELTARMVGIVKRITAFTGNDVIIAENPRAPIFNISAEARAIAAELEPVDGDRNEAERIAYDMEGALPRDLVEAGIKAGRALAEARK